MAAVNSAHQAAIANLYIAMFNRAPDADGFAFWTQALADGASLDTISRNFVTTPEARTIYPESQSAMDFVTAYYTNVLGRAPDANGLAFWTQLLENSGGVGSDAARAAVVSQIVEIVNTPLPVKPADINDTAYTLTFADRNAFTNKGVVAIYFATEYKGNDLTLAKQVLSVVGPTTTTIDAAKALLNPPVDTPVTPPVVVPDVPRHFVGNLAQDKMTGGTADDTFTFVIDKDSAGHTTLTENDEVTGAAGNDTLTVTTIGSVGNQDFALATITGIENVVLKAQAASSLTYEASAGVSTVTLEGGTASVTVGNLLDGAKFVAKDISTNSKISAEYGDAVAPDVTVSGVNGNYLQVGTAATSLTLTSIGAPTTLSAFNMGPNVANLKIVADAAFTATYLNGGKNVEVEISGSGAVNIGALDRSSFKSFDATANTGGLTTVLSVNNLAVVVKGSSANDSISTGVALTGTVDAGAGAGDRLIVTDSVAVADSTLGGKYTGFEILKAENGVSVDVANIAGITSVEIIDGAGATGVNNLSIAQAAAVSILGANALGAITIGVAGAATPGQVDTVKAALSTSGSQQIDLTGLTLNNVEKLELTGNGVTTASTGLVTLTTANATSLDSIIVKNAGGASITVDGAHTATGLTIDASASGGVVTIDASAYRTATGATIKGGAEGGTLTGSAKADFITGGAGDDVIVGDRMLATAGVATGEVQSIGLSGEALNSGTYTLGGHDAQVGAGMTPGGIVASFNIEGSDYDAFTTANPTIQSVTYDPSIGSGAIVITYKASAGNVDPITAYSDVPGFTAATTASDVSPFIPGATPAAPVGNGTHDTLTGGDGADTFRFYSADNDAEHGSITTIITDFKGSVDKIELTVTGPASIANYSEANATSADLATLLTEASAALNTTVHVYVGQVGDDSFVVSDLNGTGYTDVIQLTGVGLDRVAFEDFITVAGVTPP